MAASSLPRAGSPQAKRKPLSLATIRTRVSFVGRAMSVALCRIFREMGVAKGRLSVTSATPQLCIRALDAATGTALRDWLHPADGSELRTFGRGILAGNWVFWPIRADRRQGVFVLDQETGEPVLFDERINGNLAAGGGCLAVAGSRELSVYVPEGRLLQRRRDEAA